MKRTSCPEHYIPPTRKEVIEACEQGEVKNKAPDFVIDLCQAMAGGEILPDTVIREKVRQEIERAGFPTRMNECDGPPTYCSRLTGMMANTPQLVIDADTDKYVNFHRKVSTMIQQSLDMMPDVPGINPKDKAINLLKLIQKKNPPNNSKGKNPPPPPGGGGGGGGPGGGGGIGSGDPSEDSTEDEMDALPNMEGSNGLLKDIKEILDEVNELNDQELDMMSGEDKKPEDTNNPATAQQTKACKRMKVAEDMRNADKTILMVARKLNEFSKLKSKSEMRFRKDLEGETIVYRPMDDITELPRIRPSSWATYVKSPTLFKYNALTGNLRVTERGNFTHYKQLLYMIIDCSGSMGGERYWKAGGVLMNRLKAVVKGDAQLVWRLFDDKVYKEHYARTAKDAYASLDYMRNGKNYGGGGTDFDVALSAAAISIRENIAAHNFIKPEIMIVTDGDGQTNFRKSDLEGCVVHAVCVCDAINASLQRLTKETGGIYTHC